MSVKIQGIFTIFSIQLSDLRMHQSQNGHHAASLNGLLVKDKPQSSKEGAQDDSSQGGEDEEHHLKD